MYELSKKEPTTSKSVKSLSQSQPAVAFTGELSPRTKATYAGNIRMFFGVDRLSDITLEAIQSVTTEQGNAWALDLRSNKGLAPSTINQKMAALFGFYKFLCRRSVGLMTYNPFSKEEGSVRYKNAISTTASREPLTENETLALMNEVKPDKDKDISMFLQLRDNALVDLMVTTGIRREEACNIMIRDISHRNEKHYARIYGKGGKERIVELSDQVMAAIVEYIKKRGITLKNKEEYLFSPHSNFTGMNPRGKHMSTTSVNDVIKKHAIKAGLDPSRVSPHVLRHTFCTESLRMGAKLEDVQDLMGHSNINTTRRYDHINRVLEHSTSTALSDKYIS